MAQDTTKADAILKNYYLDVLREMVNNKALLLFGYTPEELSAGAGTANAANGETVNFRGIKRDAKAVQFAGRQWIFTGHTGRNESGTMRDEGGTLPTAGEQKWEDFTDKIRRAYKRIELSGFSIAVTERDLGAYLRLLQAETEGAIADLRKDLNRQAFGNQTGALAETTADGANTFTVDNLQYLRVGMFIDLINKSTDAVLAANRKITAINTSTRVVTYDGADVAVVAGTHVPVIEGNWKKEINGLQNMIGPDGANYATLHSVDGSVAGNEFWKGKIVDGGGTAIFDEDEAQKLLDNIGQEGWETELIVTTRGIRRRYVNTLKAMKRWNDGMATTMHGGFKAVDFDGFPLAHEDDCPKGKAFFLRLEDFLWIWLYGEDFDWMQRDGAVLTRVANKDAYEATVFKYCDLGLTQRKTQGIYKGLADDIP